MTRDHEQCDIVELSTLCRAKRDIMKPIMYGVIVSKREMIELNVFIYKVLISDGSLIAIFEDDFKGV